MDLNRVMVVVLFVVLVGALVFCFTAISRAERQRGERLAVQRQVDLARRQRDLSFRQAASLEERVAALEARIDELEVQLKNARQDAHVAAGVAGAALGLGTVH